MRVRWAGCLPIGASIAPDDDQVLADHRAGAQLRGQLSVSLIVFGDDQ